MNAAADSELDAAYARLGHQRAALVVSADAQLAEKLVALAEHHAVLAIYNQRFFATAGSLIRYGVSFPAAYVISASTPEGCSRAPSPPTCRSSNRPP